MGLLPLSTAVISVVSRKRAAPFDRGGTAPEAGGLRGRFHWRMHAASLLSSEA